MNTSGMPEWDTMIVYSVDRTEFTCIKCGYCYSCHWKKEQMEEIELRDNLKDFYYRYQKRETRIAKN